MDRLFRVNKFAALAAIWALVFVAYYATKGMQPSGALAVRSLVMHSVYLAYPVLAVRVLGTTRRLWWVSFAAAAWLAFIAWGLPQVQATETGDHWMGLLSFVLLCAWFSVLALAARTLVAAEGRSGALLSLGTFALFLLLPWGGVVFLQSRIQAVLPPRPAV